MENIIPFAHWLTHVAMFLLLVWILAKLLWRPIMSFLDERTESVANQFQEIDELKVQAEKMQAEYREQLRQAQTEARELVTKAKEDAGRLAEQLKAENQASIEKNRREAADRIAHETEQAKEELRQYVADLSIAVAGKFLSRGLTDDQRSSLTSDTLSEIERAALRN